MAYTHKVTKEGRMLFGGTANECFEWILKNQSCSVHHACEYEGYAIEPKSTEPITTEDPKLLELVKKIAEQSIERLQADDLACETNVNAAKNVVVKDGKKYIKVDQGNSGKFMVVKETGEIFGIKAYGVIHKGHSFGTLDTINQWNWGGYRAVPIS